MTKSSNISIKKELAALPLARIETMDESYSLPLREYLFTNGCQVFVNSGPTENVTYFFVVGDSNFVKKTLAFRHEIGKKQLILCWDTEDHDSIEQFVGKTTKIVYVNPTPLNPLLISDIFTFLFTAKGKELNIQSPKLKELKQSLLATENILKKFDIPTEEEKIEESLMDISPNEYEAHEKRRIAKLMTDLFGLETKKHLEVSELQLEAKEPFSQSKKGNNKEAIKKRYVSLTASIFSITLLLLILPFLLYIGSFLLRGVYLYEATNNFKEGRAQYVENNIKDIRLWGSYTSLTTPYVHTLLKIPLGEKKIQTLERIDRLLDTLTNIESDLLVINEAVVSMGSTMFLSDANKNSMTPVVAVDTIKRNMPSIRTKLDLTLSYLQSLKAEKTFPFTLSSVQLQLDKANEKIDTLRQVAQVGERVALLYPYFSGFKKNERILVLLQNSGELRPTGGFIGSIAHAVISEGLLEEMRIEDIYSLDGQLKGHIAPPTPIQELLGQEHWYLRDSNWNPDFKQSAQQILFFYEKETGEKVESVIGITSSFIVKILRVLGPVTIPTNNDQITADNFYLKSIYYTQANFFPGSTQKKDFLGALMEALLIKIQKNPQSGIAIMQILHDGIRSKDIQWYTTHEEGQQTLEQFGWGGEVPSANGCLLPPNNMPCVFSYSYINEANVSVNKVNAFVDRSESRAFQISENGTIQETITRKIQNQSQGQTGTGPYATYTRIYLPPGSTVVNLTLDNQLIPMKTSKSGKQPLPYGEPDTSIPNLVGIAVAFDVAPGRERVLTVTVTHQETLLQKHKEAMLSIFEQKQPGINAVPITTTISYPATWAAKPVPSAKIERMVAKQGYLEYNSLLSEDSEVSIRFIK